MRPNLLIVDDDNNWNEAIQEWLEGRTSVFRVKSVRTIRDAEIFIENPANRSELEACILDLMFPPIPGEAKGGVADLLPGIAFYDDYLKGVYKTVIVTGALRWSAAENLVKAKIANSKDTVLMKKPIGLEALEEVLRDWAVEDGEDS